VVLVETIAVTVLAGAGVVAAGCEAGEPGWIEIAGPVANPCVFLDLVGKQ
jgi:hypothetical protein